MGEELVNMKKSFEIQKCGEKKERKLRENEQSFRDL